jgi:alpha,alpha-trehalase
MTAANVTNDAERRMIFTGLKSAAESGWDFSSRHFRGVNGSNKGACCCKRPSGREFFFCNVREFVVGTLANTETQNLIQVELNCILQANAVVLSEWYKYFGNEVRSHFYRGVANKLLIAIEKVSTRV